MHSLDSSVRDSHISLVRYDTIDSHSEMSDLLVILAKCDEYENSISCCISDIAFRHYHHLLGHQTVAKRMSLVWLTPSIVSATMWMW
jgi:hypothetical protein